MKATKYFMMLCLAVVALGFTGCKDDDDAGSTQMNIDKIFLEDAKSTIQDREVEFARLGQTLRIQGSGFSGLKAIYVNGYKTSFNNALITDNNIWVTLNGKTPVDKADADVRNTIRLVKSGTELVYPFVIRAAAPSITSIDNTLPKAGETVTVYGANLQEISEVTLPGNVVLTSGIISDEDGEWFSFTMPADITTSGSIQAVGANGTAISAAQFNDFRCFITDFDGTGELGSWNATYSEEDLVDDPLGTGRGKVALLIPQSVLDEGGVSAGGRTNYWATAGTGNANDDWTARMYQYIPESTKASDIALQFDVYCPEEWNLTGQLEISLQNNLSAYGWGSSPATSYSTDYFNTATLWIPWLTEDGQAEPYSTTGWKTVTIPFTKFPNYNPTDAPDATFKNICEDRNAGSYSNLVMFFVNNDITFSDAVIYEAKGFKNKIYIDNLRVVSNASVTVSDFNDEEEE